jgi:hypothetical protein
MSDNRSDRGPRGPSRTAPCAAWGPGWLRATTVEAVSESPPTEPLGGPTLDVEAPQAAPAAEPHPAEAALRQEVAELERRHFFPDGFPAVLRRCIGHFLAGPCVPPAEGEAAWWAGARRQVLRMIETVRQRRL